MILEITQDFTAPCCEDPFCEGCGPLPSLAPTLTDADMDALYDEWAELVREARWEQEETLLRRVYR